jgi:hypothetical protein
MYRLFVKSIGYILCVLISVIFTLYIVNDRVVEPRTVVSVDINKVIKLYAEDLAENNLTDSELATRSALFSSELLAKAEIFSDQYGLVMLVSDATVAGVIDVTQPFYKYLVKRND